MIHTAIMLTILMLGTAGWVKHLRTWIRDRCKLERDLDCLYAHELEDRIRRPWMYEGQSSPTTLERSLRYYREKYGCDYRPKLS